MHCLAFSRHHFPRTLRAGSLLVTGPSTQVTGEVWSHKELPGVSDSSLSLVHRNHRLHSFGKTAARPGEGCAAWEAGSSLSCLSDILQPRGCFCVPLSWFTLLVIQEANPWAGNRRVVWGLLLWSVQKALRVTQKVHVQTWRYHSWKVCRSLKPAEAVL